MLRADDGREGTLERRHQDQPFTIIPNQTILDCRMSMDGYATLSYMLMRTNIPGGWTFHPREIARHFRTGVTGKRVVSALRELEELGYLERQQLRGERGRVAGVRYIVSTTSETAKKWSSEDGKELNSVQDGNSTVTRLTGSRATGSRQTGRNKKEEKQKEEKQKDLLSASADGLRQEQQMAETRTKGSDRQTSAVKAPGVQQLMPFLSIWNEHRNPARMSQHRGLDRDQTVLLQQMVAGHGGDLDAALASWTLAVQKLAAVDTRQPTNWWGDPSQPKRGLANAARHWSKHAVEHKPAPAAVNARPAYDDFELDDEEI